MLGRNVLKVDQETLSTELGGKVYIVTGANSGIGLETTRQLVRQGGHVVMACRRPDAGEEAARSVACLKGSYEVIELRSRRTAVGAGLRRRVRRQARPPRWSGGRVNGRMQLTDAQWARIAPLMPMPRGNCKLPARPVLEGWLFVTKEGCSWRGLPERYAPWHTVYMRGRRLDRPERAGARLRRAARRPTGSATRAGAVARAEA